MCECVICSDKFGSHSISAKPITPKTPRLRHCDGRNCRRAREQFPLDSNCSFVSDCQTHRKFLTALDVAGTPIIAGCQTSGDSDTQTSTSIPTDTPTSTQTETATPEPDSLFEDMSAYEQRVRDILERGHQRERQKGRSRLQPHIVAMPATPIPQRNRLRSIVNLSTEK